MTVAIDAPMPKTRDVIYGPAADIEKSLQESFVERHMADDVAKGIYGLTKAGLNVLVDELAKVAAQFLSDDLVELLGAGWRNHSRMVAAAKETLELPGIERRVPLARHRIVSTQRPSIDVFFHDNFLRTIHFAVELEFLVTSLKAIIRDGRLVQLRSGRCDVTAKLSVEGAEIAKQAAHFELDTRINLGDGIPLVVATG
jgi:hypothetical protein